MRALLVGLGDLGQRLAVSLVAPVAGPFEELVVACRRASAGAAAAALLDAAGGARVRFEELDATRTGDIEALLRRERPSFVIQCAALLSPFALTGCAGRAAQAVLAAGFAAQLPAQLVVVHAVMAAIREVDVRAMVVNCSYPDVTHPVLATRGLAPAVGVGNAAMIQARVVALLRARGEPPALVRVIGHHADIIDTMLGRPSGDAGPRVFLGEGGERADDLAYAGPPLAIDRSLNTLSAASGAAVVRALTGASTPARLSLPGPLGLPGGYPVHVGTSGVTLDLPPGVDLETARSCNIARARADGIERIDVDGTVHFTPHARAALSRLDPELAEPLPIDESAKRWRRIAAHIRAEGVA